MSERSTMRRHRKIIGRLVFWANTGAAWYDLARAAGYEVDWNDERTEARLVWEGRVVGHLHRLTDPPEWFGFAFVAEARTPRVRQLLWRMRHPRTPRYGRTVTQP